MGQNLTVDLLYLTNVSVVKTMLTSSDCDHGLTSLDGSSSIMFLWTGFLQAFFRRQENFVIDKSNKINDLLSGRQTERTWSFKIRQDIHQIIHRNFDLLKFF